MNPIDHFIKRELHCVAYVRYVDDLLLFAKSKKTLWSWKKAMIERFSRLRLLIHDGAHPRPVKEGIPFLGFTIFPSLMRIKRRKGIHFQRQLKKALIQYHKNRIDEERIAAKLLGWNNHAAYGDTLGLRKVMFSKLPDNIKNRCIEILKKNRTNRMNG